MRPNLEFRINACSKNVLEALILFLSISGTICARPEHQRCISQDCKQITESIAKSIDRTVQPCDDFYEHACGRWSTSHPVPHGTHIWNNPHILVNKVSYQLKDLLNAVKYRNDGTLESMAKKAYDVCMNTAEIEKDGIEYLLAVSDDVGGWPMITPHRERIETTYSWYKTHVTYGGLDGEGALIKINVEEDQFNYDKPTIYLDQPKWVFQGLNLMDTEEDEIKYRRFVKTVAEAFSLKRNNALPDERILYRDIDEVLKFRKLLKEIMIWGPDARDVKETYNLISIMDLQDWNVRVSKKFKSVTIHWKSFIEDTIAFSRNVHITDEEMIILHEKDYIEDLLLLLADTDEEVIVNHIHLCFIEKNLKYTNNKMRSLASAVRKESDNTESGNRWRECISTHPMRHVLSLMYVKEYFSDTTRRDVEELVFNIQNTAIEEIERSSWMSKSVKRNAVKKLKAVGFMFGYPDWYHDKKLMADYYKDQEISDVYFYNVLSYERMAYRREIEKLSPLNPIDTTDILAIDVDIGYEMSKNVLEIPAAALQAPLFSEDVPDVILYATLGQAIAHEFSHAFDQQGRMYNKHGVMEDWWDKQTLAKYNERMTCIINKYNNLPIKKLQKTHPHLHSNGMDTVNEDFSDVLGLDLAFKSYKKTRSSKKEEVTLNIPALKNLKEYEIFFYANTQVYCEYIDEDTLLYLIKNNEHSINPLRVNGPFSNMPEFSAIFGCRAGSFMNPKIKCHIWDD